MRSALDRLARIATGGQANAVTCPWHALRFQHTQALRARLIDRCSPASANKHIAALRGVLKQCWRLGLMDPEDYQRAVDLKCVRGQSVMSGRGIPTNEMLALFRSCADDPSPAGARDAAALALLYGAGLRRSEVAGLLIDSYDQDTLKVQGKGSKQRIVPVGASVKAVLDAWIARRGSRPGPFLLRVSKAGKMSDKGLSAQSVMEICYRRALRAGIKSFSPHDMRRTYISDLLDAGADIVTVKRLAGHENVQTTARYDRRGEREKEEAAQLIRLPGSR